MVDKVDIFHILKNIDSGNVSFYTDLSEEEQKTVSMVVLLKWFTGTKNKHQIIAANALLNHLVYDFGQNHKLLLYYLFLISSSGTEKSYKWINKSAVKDLYIKIISEYFKISKNKAKQYRHMYSIADLVDMANEMGYDEDTMKKIK